MEYYFCWESVTLNLLCVNVYFYNSFSLHYSKTYDNFAILYEKVHMYLIEQKLVYMFGIEV